MEDMLLTVPQQKTTLLAWLPLLPQLLLEVRLQLMLSPTMPLMDMVLELTVMALEPMVPVLMEPTLTVLDMLVAMALTAPLLEFTSTDLPLLLPQLWLEAMLPLAATVPTVPVLSTVPR